METEPPFIVSVEVLTTQTPPPLLVAVLPKISQLVIVAVEPGATLNPPPLLVAALPENSQFVIIASLLDPMFKPPASVVDILFLTTVLLIVNRESAHNIMPPPNSPVLPEISPPLIVNSLLPVLVVIAPLSSIMPPPFTAVLLRILPPDISKIAAPVMAMPPPP